jgi:hypothetical protein
VVAWWRVNVGATVHSAAVARTADGSELWLSVTRNGAIFLERMPLHEAGIGYLDSSVAATSDANGIVTGLDHLEGQVVRVAIDGQTLFDPDPTVVGGEVDLGADFGAKPVVVGLPFSAKATTLPKDTRTGKTRSSKLGVLLYDSALPKIQGRRPPDRTPSIPMDTGEPRTSKRVKVAGALGWSDEGTLDIEQDLPFRTEILAIYETAAVNVEE